MTAYESNLLATFKKAFDSGEHHYDFEAPKDPKELEQLEAALKHLEELGEIIVLASPSETGDDYVEVEMFPPCCVPPVRQ